MQILTCLFIIKLLWGQQKNLHFHNDPLQPISYNNFIIVMYDSFLIYSNPLNSTIIISSC